MSLFNIFKEPIKAPPVTKTSFVQQIEKAGLLVTTELNKALEECQAKVTRISRDCRMMNRKHRYVCSSFVRMYRMSDPPFREPETPNLTSKMTVSAVSTVSPDQSHAGQTTFRISIIHLQTFNASLKYSTSLNSSSMAQVRAISCKVVLETAGLYLLLPQWPLRKGLWRNFASR